LTVTGDARTHRLPDGRRLAYAEYGDPSGTPVLLVHGNPGSRLFWGRCPGSPFRPGLRLIAPDRPGVGFSDFGSGRTVVDWPEDVVSLADALGIEKFVVFGPSGGGPYALACAWKIPDRVAAVGVFAPMGPYRPETIEGLVPSVAALYRMAPRFPRLIRFQMALFALLAIRVPTLYFKIISHEFSATDHAVYQRLRVGEWLIPDRREFYRQWGRGVAYDVTIPATWPIPLSEIRVPVHLWQGEQDITVPPSSSRYVARQIPDCRATFIPDAGHFWVFEHIGDILDTLVRAGTQRAQT
jgi:pimeloyl-ACP methyl ester carboxylesterase